MKCVGRGENGYIKDNGKHDKSDQTREVNEMSILKITQENFNQEVLQSDIPVLVDFWADWCGPCRMMSPILDQLAQKHSEIRAAKVNVDEQPGLAAQ